MFGQRIDRERELLAEREALTMKPIDLGEAIRWGAAGPHPRERGWVLWFKPAKGHGRIKADQDGEVLFVLYGQIRGEGFRTLEKGQRVEFSRVPCPDGWHAHDVQVLPDPAPKQAG